MAVRGCGGNSMAFGYREGSIALFCSKGEDAGQEQPETQGASALFGMYSGWRVFGDGQRGEGKRDSGQGGVCGPDHERGSDTGKRRNKKG